MVNDEVLKNDWAGKGSANALLGAAASSADALAKGDNGFGQIYVLRFQMTTGKGMATVLSAWIVRHGEDFPRLTTCFIV